MLMDLDLVNPYFLSSGCKDVLEKAGIKVISPLYANSNVDIPALPADMNLAFERDDYDVVMDVGGDDAGSVVLGRFHEQISKVDYEMLYVINRYRNLTMTPEDTVEILKEIETASRAKACGLVNNSHLKQETVYETVADSLGYAAEVSKQSGLPIFATTVPKYLEKDDRVKQMENDNSECNFYPIDIYVKAPWE